MAKISSNTKVGLCSAGTMERLIRAMKMVETLRGGGGVRVHRGPETLTIEGALGGGLGGGGFWAKITDEPDPGAYSWSSVVPDPASPGQYKDPDSPRTGTGDAHEANGAGGIPVDTVVWLRATGVDDSGDPVFGFTRGGGGLVPVDLSRDGGADGTLTTQCSYTYTAYLNSELVGQGLTPAYQRRTIGSYTQATTGLGYYDQAGDFRLKWTDEVPEVAVC